MGQYAESLKPAWSQKLQKILEDKPGTSDSPRYRSARERFIPASWFEGGAEILGATSDTLATIQSKRFDSHKEAHDKVTATKEEIDAITESIDEQTKRLENILKTVDNAGSQKSLRTVSPSRWGGLLRLDVIDEKAEDSNFKTAASDNINMIPYGESYPANTDDYIKFKFYDVYNNKWIIFRALLSGITDTITPEWSGTRYIGRPDQVYVYTGTDREIGFTFDIYPKSVQELPLLMEKLNYLIGMCYPSFYEGQRMIAPFINLTIGDMFVDTPGFLSSLGVSVGDMSTWEIDTGLQFPKHITCDCSFTYIGKYLPSSLGKHYELRGLVDKGWTRPTGKDDEVVYRGTYQLSKDKLIPIGRSSDPQAHLNLVKKNLEISSERL
jgi:hypothetical protein